MGLISTSIPNLINGVSQQPPSLRLSTQCEAMVNCYPSIVEGLIKRPPTEHVAELINGDAGEAFVHIYNRDPDERYVVVIRNGTIKVFDIDGDEKTVDVSDAGTGAYLTSSTPAKDFRAITIADYTLIVNKTIETDTDSSLTSPENASESLVFVKQGSYGQTFKVYVDGVLKATKTTSTTDATDITTIKIATDLATALTTNLGAGWTVSRVNHVISIIRDDGVAHTTTIEDSLAGEALKAINGKTQLFTDLPLVAPDGYIVEITGDNTSNFDNYYVKFVADDGTFSEGYWEETIAPGIEYAFDRSTMPYQLVRESDGSFTLSRITWDNRVVGDLDSAPWPTFIGQKINDIVFFRNRLGIIAGQNVVLSTAGEYFNFFPSTVTQLLDDAPIDLAASHTKVSIIKHAVPFNKQLLLFSDQTQFVLESDELLTPRTAAITTATEFESDEDVKPTGAGQNVYFVTARGDFAGVREYFVDSDAETLDAADVTAHVPQLVPASLLGMDISTAEDVLVLASDDASHDNRLYIYKYYWQGREKLQSAWSYWEFASDVKVRGMKFINSTLYIVLQRGTDGLFLEKVQIEPSRVDPNAVYLTHLDRRISDEDCTVTYDPIWDETKYEMPYNYGFDLSLCGLVISTPHSISSQSRSLRSPPSPEGAPKLSKRVAFSYETTC